MRNPLQPDPNAPNDDQDQHSFTHTWAIHRSHVPGPRTRKRTPTAVVGLLNRSSRHICCRSLDSLVTTALFWKLSRSVLLLALCWRPGLFCLPTTNERDAGGPSVPLMDTCRTRRKFGAENLLCRYTLRLLRPLLPLVLTRVYWV